jgi:uncharacterized protein YcbK (DUF882 family)
MGDYSKHFSHSELRCKCCSSNKMDSEFMELIEALRTVYNAPMKITSGYRCGKYNQKVSTTGETGPHTTGQAIDIQVSEDDAFLLVHLAFNLGFPGIGINQKGKHKNRFIHIDTLKTSNRPAIWTY